MTFRDSCAVVAVILVFSALLGSGVERALAQSSVSPDQWEGQRVTAVRVVDDSGAVLESNPAGLPLQPGQPYSAAAERESLRQLYRTGRYADLVAELTPVEGGVRLDFAVAPTYYVNKVAVLGLPDPPSPSAAASALRLNLGEGFRESAMAPALDRLRQTIEDEGLYNTKLSYKLDPKPASRQMDITVVAEAGGRARAGTITLVDDTPFSESELRGRLGVGTGTPITSERINLRTERVRSWLVDRGYLGARVTVTRGQYDPQTNRVPLAVRVLAGRNIRVHIEGADISTRTLRRLLPIYAEGAVDDDLLQEGRRNLRDYLQGQGYFDAEVDYTTSGNLAPDDNATPLPRPADDIATITYDITRGPRHRLVGVSIEGEKYFDAETLRARLRMQPADFASPGRFSNALLDADVASLKGLYLANGFLDIQVTSDLASGYQGKPDDIFVRLKIVEGPQTLVGDLQIEGNSTLTSDQLMGVIGSTPGQPFSDFNVTADRDNVLALYYDRGFPEARFTATANPMPVAPGQPQPRISLVYRVEEGAPLRVANILVDGYDHTRRGVIGREVQLQPGQPLSEGAVVETQRRLYDLGIFSRVSIAPQNPAGSDPDKNMTVLVEEARRYTIGYGGGFEAQRLGGAGSGPTGGQFNVSPRAIFQVSKLNLTGRADTLTFRARASTLQGRGLLTYNSSNYFGWRNLSFQLSALFDKSRDVLTFTSTRSEASAQLLYRFSPTSSMAWRYSYRRIVASDLQINPQQIPLYSQPTRVSLFGVTWLRDRRDNAADPGHGALNTVSIDLAGQPIGSSASFVRLFLQNSTYTPIGRRLLFARSMRLGVSTPIGSSASTDIALPERFFAGGGTTLRGFGLNQAGPRDPLTGFPVGGLTMLVFNQELRFPMRLPWIGNRVGGGVFYDAGNVFSRFGNVTLRTAPPAPVFSAAQPTICVSNCTNDLAYFSHTVGFALRYNTPIGPVSIDLGYQLNPARFLVPTATTPAAGQPTPLTLDRLSSFQFFVNLGTTF
jgi:outer membrane protein assembly complex protein YaeT